MLIIRQKKRILASVLAIALLCLVPAGPTSAIANPIDATKGAGIVGTAYRNLAPDITTELSDEEKANPPKFAETIDLEALAKEAKHVPITTVADLVAEIAAESTLSEEQLKARSERNANIGSIGVVNVSNSLNVRDGADGDANIVGKLYQNTGVIIGNYSGNDGEWVYVNSGSVCGWVVSQYIATGNLATSLYNAMEPQVATVVADNTTVYEEADSDSDDMTELSAGKQLPVLEIEGDYVKVQVTSYAEGYVLADHVSVDNGLATGVPADVDEEVQIDIEVRAETRRILAEQEAAEAAEAERLARERAEAAASSRNSSSSSSSSTPYGNVGSTDGSGWTYLGKFRVTFYCKESCGGNTRTASGATATEHYTCATSSQISFGSTVKVDGYGTWVVQDRGVGNNQIDLYVPASEAYGLFYRDVWIKN